MTNDWNNWLAANSEKIRDDIYRLTGAATVLLRDAIPPTTHGVYMFLVDSQVMYVGEAKGSGGLRDRILSKHLSGSDSHTLQREFKNQFPDRQIRRDYLKDSVSVKWVEIDDPDRVSTVERTVIQMLRPPWNRT